MGASAIPTFIASSFLAFFEGGEGPGGIRRFRVVYAGRNARMQFVPTMRRNGVHIEGRVTRVERKERSSECSSSTKSRKRLSYQYTNDCETYAGQTLWAKSGQFGALGADSSIPVVADHTWPERSAREKELPLRAPEIVDL